MSSNLIVGTTIHEVTANQDVGSVLVRGSLRNLGLNNLWTSRHRHSVSSVSSLDALLGSGPAVGWRMVDLSPVVLLRLRLGNYARKAKVQMDRKVLTASVRSDPAQSTKMSDLSFASPDID